ncbi:MAG: 2Fe-2S iron-sulfur cluster-binding protein [Myxococcota bacterium]
MPSLTIDGNEIEFQPDESIMQVADRSAIEIPYYCWHRRLSVAANCRMCLVEVEKAPKLLPACQTECRDGMVVTTTNETVKDAQRAVHEFLLINHPVDCPICDQAGECKLQDYYMEFQLTSSRMRDAKVAKPRLEQLGPHVLYNGERCILCTRCIRFMDEIAGDSQLGVFNRGDRAIIGTFPGQPLDNPYSLNTVEICPVGALTSAGFRFKQRSWNLRRSPSICSGCARGCNVYVDQRAGQVYRLKPRENDAVNQGWMCDEGFLSYGRANDGRLTEPLARRSGGDDAVECSAQDAMARAVELLAPIASAGQGLGVVLSLHATCEEAYVLGMLAKDVLGVGVITLFDRPDGEADEILRVADRNPNRAGVTRIVEAMGLEIGSSQDLKGKIESGSIKAVLCVGHETGDPDAAAKAAAGLEVFIHVAHARTALAERADVTLPSLSWAQTDGTWINVDGRAQRLTPAFAPQKAARPAHVWLLDLAAGLGASFALPSVQTIRAEIERSLDAFERSSLTDVGPRGRLLG